jgi:hypothetical protein
MTIESFNDPMEVSSKVASVSADILAAEAFLIAEGVLMESAVRSRAPSSSSDDAAFASAVRRWRRSVQLGSFQAAA